MACDAVMTRGYEYGFISFDSIASQRLFFSRCRNRVLLDQSVSQVKQLLRNLILATYFYVVGVLAFTSVAERQHPFCERIITRAWLGGEATHGTERLHLTGGELHR